MVQNIVSQEIRAPLVDASEVSKQQDGITSTFRTDSTKAETIEHHNHGRHLDQNGGQLPVIRKHHGGQSETSSSRLVRYSTRGWRCLI